MDTTPSVPVQRRDWRGVVDASVLLAIRVVVGGVFVTFGVAKAFESPEEFMTAIVQYQLIPNQLLYAFAIALVIAEIVFGLCFLLGLWMRQAIVGLLALLMMFVLAIGQAMARGLVLDSCGCSGSVISLGDTPQDVLIRDGVLFALMVWAWVRRAAHRWTLDAWFARSR